MMPSVSQAQARYFGAVKGGSIPKPKGISDATVTEFASTQRKGLPQHAEHKYYGEGKLSDAFGQNKGGLHRATGTPESQPIPAGKVRAASNSDDSHLQHMAQAAINMNHRRYYGAK